MNRSPINEVEGKVAIVTGAASGIGRAIVELLHARGAQVIAEDIDPKVTTLARQGIVPLVADITVDGVAERAVELALQHFGKLDILVNNAGRIIYKNLVDMSRDKWNWQMETNVTGTFQAAPIKRAAMPEEIAEIVLFLASERASYIVGSVVMADGGMSVAIA